MYIKKNINKKQGNRLVFYYPFIPLLPNPPPRFTPSFCTELTFTHFIVGTSFNTHCAILSPFLILYVPCLLPLSDNENTPLSILDELCIITHTSSL